MTRKTTQHQDVEDASLQWLALQRHPTCPSHEAFRVDAHFKTKDAGVFEITHRIIWVADEMGDASPAPLHLPPPSPSRREDDLWRTTCLEAFFKPNTTGVIDDAAYWEINISPSTAWASYFFSDYRTGGYPSTDLVVTDVSVQHKHGMLVTNAHIETRTAEAQSALRTAIVGLSAVLETSDRSLSYWALAHGSAKPDFHHQDSFTLHT